ncbi:MAG: hypothetical protein RLZZ519_3423 [Bacteroidota bacterium]|jgi:hypothetical protein
MEPTLIYPIRIGYNRAQLTRKVLITMGYAVVVILHWFLGFEYQSDGISWALRLCLLPIVTVLLMLGIQPLVTMKNALYFTEKTISCGFWPIPFATEWKNIERIHVFNRWGSHGITLKLKSIDGLAKKPNFLQRQLMNLQLNYSNGGELVLNFKMFDCPPMELQEMLVRTFEAQLPPKEGERPTKEWWGK